MNLPFTSFDTAERQDLIEDGIYLVAVPSLNICGGMHQILVEIFDADWIALNSTEGREGKNYACIPNSDEHPLRVMLGNGCTIEAVVKHDDLVKWRIVDAIWYC